MFFPLPSNFYARRSARITLIEIALRLVKYAHIKQYITLGNDYYFECTHDRRGSTRGEKKKMQLDCHWK